MPVPSRRLKDLIEGTVDHHASQRWPTLEEVTIRWRGSYGYLTGYLSEDDDDTIELCRIQYLGNPDEWAFAIWQASTDSYAESVLLDGRPAGHPNLALDTACTLYLAGISDHPEQPDKPLKDLRGAALADLRNWIIRWLFGRGRGCRRWCRCTCPGWCGRWRARRWLRRRWRRVSR